MGIRFKEIIDKTYIIGEKYLVDGEITELTDIRVSPCAQRCKFDCVKYRCDGTRLRFNNRPYTVCPFHAWKKDNLVGVPAVNTNTKW